MKKVRILLIEDNRLLREGISAIINGQKDMRVVAAFAGGNETLLQIRETKPDVLLLDLGLRSGNGMRIVKSIVNEIPRTKVIGMGLIPVQSDIVEFIEAGASGFIIKDASEKDFLGTLRTVAKGGKVLPPSLTGSLFSHVIDHALQNGDVRVNNAVKMTKREREVIVLIADSLSNKDIARRLNIATYTVKSHVHNILEKLALHSRLQIAKYSHDDDSSPT